METAGRALDDKELKRAMRSAGLGTPATRASILQTLLNRGYIERKKRDLRSTDRGRTLIQAIPVDEIKSAALTGRWESRLSNVADGKESREAFMADVVNNLKGMIDAINSAKPPPSEAPSTPVLGTCPICGTDVHEGHAAYSCRTGRACSFVVFKTIARRKISKSTVKQLLKDGQSKPLKNFKSKKNKPFHAALRLNEEGRVVFEFSTEPSTARATPKVNAQSKTPRSPVGMTCPECRQGSLIRGRAAWGCDQWRSGCRFVLSFDEGNTPLTAARAVSMIQRRLAAAPKG